MKAMILAAGRGSRLGNLSEHSPKALVKVNGLCMLDHVVERLKCVGVNSIVINLHYRGDQIENHIKSKNNYNIEIQFSWEEKLLDTGGAIKRALPLLGDQDFLLHNCDVYSNFCLQDLMNQHVARGDIATLAVNQRNSSRTLVFDRDRLVGWENRDSGKSKILVQSSEAKHYSFCSVQMVSKELLSYFAHYDGEVFSLIEVYLAASADGKNVSYFDIGESLWFDVGSPEKIAELEQKLSEGFGNCS